MWDANGDAIPNPNYIENYIPRYYQFGEDDIVPIYNQGDVYWDPDTETWHGDAEVLHFAFVPPIMAVPWRRKYARFYDLH